MLDAPCSAYGINLSGPVPRSAALLPGMASWPTMQIVADTETDPDEPGFLGADRALVRLGAGGSISFERDPLRAVFRPAAALSSDRFVHPYLAAAAGVAAHWLAREPFHAGAVIRDGGAWGVVGTNESGKSTLLAALARRGVTVLTDDLLVLEDGMALAGPRCVDLRPESAVRLGAGAPAVRDGIRNRISLPPAPAATPLRGWIFLAWSGRTAAVPLSPTERLSRLMTARAVGRSPYDGSELMRLAGLPGWELRRPQRWSSLNDTVDCLLQLSER